MFFNFCGGFNRCNNSCNNDCERWNNNCSNSNQNRCGCREHWNDCHCKMKCHKCNSDNREQSDRQEFNRPNCMRYPRPMFYQVNRDGFGSNCELEIVSPGTTEAEI